MASTTLPASSVISGCILWLTDPNRGRYSGRYSHSDSDSDDDPGFREPRTMYGHPVMVLHSMGTDNVVVCLLTTLNGRDIKIIETSCDHEFYLAIYPKEPPCVQLYPQLCLERCVTLRKDGYLCIRERHSVDRSKLELYDRMRPADYYKLSPLSYAIVANTFRMNIPIPQDLTPSERYRGMRIPLAGPQLSRTQRAVTSHAEAETPYEEAQSSAVQAPQDRKIMDHVSATANVTTEDCRMTDKTPTTQDPPTPAKAEKPDELVGGHKVPFHMMRSRFVSLLLRVIGYKGASTEPRTKVQSIPGCQDQVSTAPSGGQVN